VPKRRQGVLNGDTALTEQEISTPFILQKVFFIQTALISESGKSGFREIFVSARPCLDKTMRIASTISDVLRILQQDFATAKDCCKSASPSTRSVKSGEILSSIPQTNMKSQGQ